MSTPAPAATTTYPAAELDRRFYAFAVDRLVAWGTFAGAAYLAWRFFLDDGDVLVGVGVIVATVVLVSLVFAVLLGVAGTSPGKALVGLRVVRAADGGPIGLSKALLRTAVLGMFTLPTLGLGLATLAWTAVMDPGGRRRGGHDRMTDAVVVDVRPAPVAAVEDPRPRAIVNLTAMRLMPSPVPDPTPAPTPVPAPARISGPPTAAPPVPAAPAAPAPAPPAQAPPSPPTAPVPTAPTMPVAPAPVAPPAAALSGPTVRRPDPVASTATRWRVTFDTGETFVVEGLALVGRRPEGRAGEPVAHLVPLRSSDMSLSKTHAQFQVVPDGALVVMDRGSTNGSVVVRQGVSKSLTAGRPSTLVDGDTVRFGDRTMTVHKETP
ncbi:RDD family protein [Nocardioides rubriscoriae]|uniref:RDD family protein n=1 Tax=Nocardioides rubriscoriae TaxID=642762 RepID=UPI0011DF457C|nr:RDD family protein [Nocardioides rubriscoriae]